MSVKKAILVVSFGTSYEVTRKKTIDKIEDDIRKEFKAYKVYRAFTSKIIIAKLLREGIVVNNLEEAMVNIIEDGVEELIIQPTHIINGTENNNMIDVAKKYKNQFKKFHIGRPLLTNIMDYQEIVPILANKFYREDSILVLMGHGTSHFANAAYPALDYSFKQLGYLDIYVGTVEGYPDINDVIKLVTKNEKKKVILAPFMIVAGDHAINDMSGENENSWKNIFLSNNYKVECILQGLGEFKEVRKLFINRINDALEDHSLCNLK